MNLILYFSAENGKTAKIAKDLAERLEQKSRTGQETQAAIRQEVAVIEIKPEVSYSPADLRYLNPLARCNKEKLLKKDIPISPETKESLNQLNWSAYNVVYLGFPIWYGGAPNVVNSFCKGLNWTGKKVHVFATSMKSGIGKTAEKLKPFLNGAEIVEAQRVKTAEEISI